MQNILPASFGYHTSDLLHNKVDRLPISLKILQTITKVGIAALTVLAILGTVGWGVAIGAGIGLALTDLGCTVLHRQIICETAGIILAKNEVPQLKIAPNLTASKGFPTEHGADTELWRKRLKTQHRRLRQLVRRPKFCRFSEFN